MCVSKMGHGVYAYPLKYENVIIIRIGRYFEGGSGGLDIVDGNLGGVSLQCV